MGKKGNWFVAVKKVFSPESNEKRDLKKSKSKKKWGFGKEKDHETSSSVVEETIQPTPLLEEEVKLDEVENEQNKEESSGAVARAAHAETGIAAPRATVDVVRQKNARRFPGKSEEEVAAIKIQTAFRGYLARRALRALRGLVRLKTLIHGQSVKRQATNTLRCMQTVARVQSQVRSRRIRMAEENQALQRQLQLKRDKELENMRASMGGEWDDSSQSKEQIEASLLHKKEAAMRREKALAYAFSHQQMSRNASRSTNPMFMDPNNPHWGWSWLERWMAARPWETRSTISEKELNDQSSVKSATRSVGVTDISKSYVSREAKADKPSPRSRKPSGVSPSTPQSRPVSSLPAGKLKSASPGERNLYAQDEDGRSSLQSERPRRHSIAGSLVRDDESLASSSALPSYMIPTRSARAKLRLQSPVTVENEEILENGSSGSVKKRLSFPASPSVPRRHSGPPKVESSSIKSINV